MSPRLYLAKNHLCPNFRPHSKCLAQAQAVLEARPTEVDDPNGRKERLFLQDEKQWY